MTKLRSTRAASLTSFDVRFLATTGYKVTVMARSEERAIAKAQKLWETKGDEPFTPWSGHTDGWEAFAD
jgi:hypothetical protein